MKRNARAEQVLLYQFDEDKGMRLNKVFQELRIPVTVLEENAHVQTIGFLLGMKGFPAAQKPDHDFRFPQEVMILHNIRGKRLDEVLRAISAAGIPKILYKAIVTPFNTLWTLRRLCETMQREHAAIIRQQKITTQAEVSKN